MIKFVEFIIDTDCPEGPKILKAERFPAERLLADFIQISISLPSPMFISIRHDIPVVFSSCQPFHWHRRHPPEKFNITLDGAWSSRSEHQVRIEYVQSDCLSTFSGCLQCKKNSDARCDVMGFTSIRSRCSSRSRQNDSLSHTIHIVTFLHLKIFSLCDFRYKLSWTLSSAEQKRAVWAS